MTGAGGRYARFIPIAAWLAGTLFALTLFAADIATSQRAPGLSINGFALWGRDFVNVWTSGRLVLDGNLGILYDIKPYRAWQSEIFGPGVSGHNYSYPPLTLLYTPVFGSLPYLWALALWLIGSLIVFTWAAKPWLERYKLPWWLGAVLPSTIVCLWAGHYGLIVGALWLGAWHMLDRNPRLSGVMIGLMAIKPHLAILMPLMLLKRRAWTAIAWAALTVGALVFLSLIIFGPELWQTYLTSTSRDQVNLVDNIHTFFIKMMPTLAPALFSYGFPANIVWPLQFLLAGGAIAALWFKGPEDRHGMAMATAIATFLVLPYGFNYDMTVIGLAALLLMTDRVRSGRYGQALIAAFAFVLPSVVMDFNRDGVWIAPLALLALFTVSLQSPKDPVTT